MAIKTSNELDFLFLISHFHDIGLPVKVLKEIELFYRSNPNPSKKQIDSELMPKLEAMYSINEEQCKIVTKLVSI